MPTDVPQPVRDRRAVRWALVGLVATAAIAFGAFLGARAVARDDGSSSRAHTVRDFLITVLAERNGVTGCRYLTPRAVRAVAAAEPRDTPCEAALPFARLTLGGRDIRLESTIKGLDYHVEDRSGRVWVTVRADGSGHTFELRRATQAELNEFEAPDTPWRIEAGVAALVRR